MPSTGGIGWAAALVTAGLALAGCGADEPGSESPPSAVECPYEGFSTTYVPRDWSAGFVEVCHSDDQNEVLVVNVSTVFVEVGSTGLSSLVDWGTAPDSTFQSLVHEQIAIDSSAPGGTRMVPPGGWAVVSGAPAAATVGLPVDVLAAAYATDKLIGYVEARMTSPDRAAARAIAGCVKEVGVVMVNQQNSSVDLDYLLADAALGAGLQCGPLLRELTGDTPPPATTLQAELARFQTTVRASATDDLVRIARNAVQVLR